MLMSNDASGTQALAEALSRIIRERTDFRSRVDAIFDALKLHSDYTGTAALVIVLASVSEQPIRNN